MKKFFQEFKVFIERGNVVDLAVGVVIGGAFSKIVTSVVDDLIMPIIGMIIGGYDFSSLSITVGTASIRYGSFIQNTMNFLIIAFCIFVMVKIINRIIKKKEKKAEAPKKSEEVLLLEQIRDLLKKNQPIEDEIIEIEK